VGKSSVTLFATLGAVFLVKVIFRNPSLIEQLIVTPLAHFELQYQAVTGDRRISGFDCYWSKCESACPIFGGSVRMSFLDKNRVRPACPLRAAVWPLKPKLR
jgi:hypothetical protein